MEDSILRRQIVDALRYLEDIGLNFGYSGNISAKIDENHIIITPTGLRKSKLSPEDLVIVDLYGHPLKENSKKPSSELPTHLAIYKARKDVRAIVHVHPIYSSVFAVLHENVLPVLEETVIFLGGEIKVAEYAPTGTDKLGENVVKALEDRSAVILANHGLLTVGRSVNEAVELAVYAERAAKIYFFAKLMGKPNPLPEYAISLERKMYLQRLQIQ